MTSHSDQVRDNHPVVVIGGRGFVGSHVTRRLVAKGWRPHLFGPAMEDDLLADLAGQFDETAGSVEDRDALQLCLRHSGAQHLVTTAAYSSGRAGLMRSSDAEADKALAVNLLGMRNILEAALAEKVQRVVWTSSTVVYGPDELYGQEPVNEDAASAPQTFYGLTKELAESLCNYYRARHGMDITGLRLPLILGPGLWYQGAASTIVNAIAAASEREPLHVEFHDKPVDLMHVEDVADAILLALMQANPAEAIYNINGFTTRFSDVIAELETLYGQSEIDIAWQEPAMVFPLVDDSRFRDRYAFSPRFGLRQVIESMAKKEPENV